MRNPCRLVRVCLVGVLALALAVTGAPFDRVAVGAPGPGPVSGDAGTWRRGADGVMPLSGGPVRPDWVSATVTARATGRQVEVLSERTVSARSWPWATVYLIDNYGRLVQTGTQHDGRWALSTVAYDNLSRVTSAWTARARRAIGSGPTATDLATTYTYVAGANTDTKASLIKTITAPVHQFGPGALAPYADRPETIFNYTSQQMVGSVVTKYVPSATGQIVDLATTYQYEASSAPTTPTQTTVVMADPTKNMVSTSTFDAQGRVIEQTQPGGFAFLTVYYTAGANTADAACGNKPAWAGLPCVTKPATQPAGTPVPSTVDDA